MSTKAKMIQEPYKGNGLKFKQGLENSIDELPTIDKVYTHEKGFKWLINSRGYVHMWIKKTVRATHFDGEKFEYYQIEHYRITANEKLYQVGSYMYYKREAMEQAFAEIQ